MTRKLTLLLLLCAIMTLALHAEPKEKPEFPPVDKIVKDMNKQEGFITLFQKDENVFALIKAGQMKKPFLLAMTVSGGIYTGMQWDHMMVYWEKQDKQILLVRPDVRHRAPKTTFEDVVEKTFPATIIRSLPIVGKGQGGYLINFNQLFKGNLSGISLLAGGSPNPRLSKWSKVKSFPENVELRVEAAFSGSRSSNPPNWTDMVDGGRSSLMSIHYSLASIPKTGYKPRKADSRVGYFNTAIKDFSAKHDTRTHFERYIHRWHLEKIDPSLELSPPKTPIIFYIEKTVPYRYRRYVREAILEWNKTFEKIGIIDAIVVRQQTNKEFADLDPEDARYNFFRWTTHDMGFAAGPSRVNPLTGEIFDADIIFDDSMLRYNAQSYIHHTPTAMLFGMAPELKTMLEKSVWKNFLKDDPVIGRKGKDFHANHKWHKEIQEKFANKQPTCSLAQGMRHQLNFAYMLVLAKGKDKLPDEFIGETIREVVIHEVGHTLGLYHNFKASSWLSLDKINSKEKPVATSGSIMDYNPINFTPKDVLQGHYVPQAIGPYDYWAIEYGYSIPKKISEEKMLANIAKKVAGDGLGYGNDFYATMLDPDPLLIRWDLGDDPVAYAKLRLQLCKELEKNIVERVVEVGEDYYPVRKSFNTLLFDYFYSSVLAARNIGGIYLHWDHRGDPNGRSPFIVVPAEKQAESLEFLAANIFSEEAFQVSPKLLKHLAPGIWWHWESDESDGWASYPIHQRVLSIQMMTLFAVLNPVNLDRLHNSPMSVEEGEAVFTIADLLNGLTDAIWSELKKDPSAKKWNGKTPFINSMRRNLQRLHLNIWIYYFVLDNFVMFIPEDARVIAWQNLNELSQKIKELLAKKDLLDSTSRAHLQETEARIQQVLKAKFSK